LQFGGHGPGLLALAPGVEVGHAGHQLEGPAEAGVDEALAVEPLVQGAGFAEEQVAGQVP
jgi:hypothetical protein